MQCGVNTGLAGFSQPDSKGVWNGIDVDLCRAVAAAVFGDADKVRYTPLTAQQRFTALQSGEVDMLSRNTTWTITRDTSLGLNFVGVNFYDGQGFMVPKKLNVKSAKQLNGATVCVQPGTTTELNLADYFRANRMTFKPVVIEKLEEVLNAYFSGRCDVFTTDVSGLVSTRGSRAPKPGRPRHPARGDLQGAARAGRAPRRRPLVRHRQVVAVRHDRGRGDGPHLEEHRPGRPPARTRRCSASSARPATSARCSASTTAGRSTSSSRSATTARASTRNLKPLGFERGLNQLWTKGGLMYAPPIR